MDILKRIEELAAPGTEIPKPVSIEPFLVKGWGKRRNEKALIYHIPNNRGGRPYEKGVTANELLKAYRQLADSGEFSRSWFNKNLSSCAKEGGCNFTTIGGLLNLIGVAQYSERGIYVKI